MGMRPLSLTATWPLDSRILELQGSSKVADRGRLPTRSVPSDRALLYILYILFSQIEKLLKHEVAVRRSFLMPWNQCGFATPIPQATAKWGK